MSTATSQQSYDASEPSVAKQKIELTNSVLAQMETRCLFVKVPGNIMRPGPAVRSEANIHSTGRQRLMNTSKLFNRIVGMQVLHQLVAISNVDASHRNRNARTIRYD